MAVSDDNPFWNFTLEQCQAAVLKIQQRMLNNTQQVSHAGTGSVLQAESKNDRVNLRYLRERIADLTGEKSPATVTAWRSKATVLSE